MPDKETLALLKAALCLAALHAHCATAYATENCVVCGDDEATDVQPTVSVVHVSSEKRGV